MRERERNREKERERERERERETEGGGEEDIKHTRVGGRVGRPLPRVGTFSAPEISTVYRFAGNT